MPAFRSYIGHRTFAAAVQAVRIMEELMQSSSRELGRRTLEAAVLAEELAAAEAASLSKKGAPGAAQELLSAPRWAEPNGAAVGRAVRDGTRYGSAPPPRPAGSTTPGS